MQGTWLRSAFILLGAADLARGSPPSRIPATTRGICPRDFPKPYVPADNPMTAAKVELGRYLFYDTRMSVNGKAACATCHKQELAFTDGRAVGIGATGESHSRSAMSLVNVAYSAALTWSNPKLTRLEEQALTPMFGDHPVELGLREGDGFLPMLRSDPKYRALFERAFPSEADRFHDRQRHQGAGQLREEHRLGAVRPTIAIIMTATTAPYRTPPSAARFYSSISTCPVSDAMADSISPTPRSPSANPSAANRISQYRALQSSRLAVLPGAQRRNLRVHQSAADVGKFKAPTLRNIAVTAPYMHDGSIPTLEGVLDHYAAGGRKIVSGPYAGNGHDNPNKDPLIGGFTLSAGSRGPDRLSPIADRRCGPARLALRQPLVARITGA